MQGLESVIRAAAAFSTSNQMLRRSPAGSSFAQAAEHGASAQSAQRSISDRMIFLSNIAILLYAAGIKTRDVFSASVL
jgi:hypothetical protein